MSLIKELDYGTPIRVSEKTVTLTIDGVSVSVPAGTSVMAAAMSMGTKIPKLCATDSLEPFGSCRLCLVEIEGRRGTPASCTTPAEEGMIVRTQTDTLHTLRKGAPPAACRAARAPTAAAAARLRPRSHCRSTPRQTRRAESTRLLV